MLNTYHCVDGAPHKQYFFLNVIIYYRPTVSFFAVYQVNNLAVIYLCLVSQGFGFSTWSRTKHRSIQLISFCVDDVILDQYRISNVLILITLP